MGTSWYPELDTEKIVERYINGESENAIAKSYNVARGTISRRLRDAGIVRRTTQEAQMLHQSQLTKDQQMKNLEAAHFAVKNRIPSNRSKIKNLETSIYVLKRDGLVFYVGSTTYPVKRFQEHRQRFGQEIEIDILKTVTEDMRVIEECRAIVEQFDSGAELFNLRTPHNAWYM